MNDDNDTVVMGYGYCSDVDWLDNNGGSGAWSGEHGARCDADVC